MKFNLEIQGNDSIRDYYRKVTKYGRMLGFQNNIENQFLRGLSPDNMLKVDRIGANRSLEEIVDALEKLKRGRLRCVWA